MMEWWTYFVGNADGFNQVLMIECNGSFGNPIYLLGGGSSTEPIAAAGFNNDGMEDKGDEHCQLLQLLQRNSVMRNDKKIENKIR